MPKKKASTIVLRLNEEFRIDADGPRMNFMPMHKKEVDTEHHLAKADGPSSRWVCLGYYPSLVSAVRACHTKMIDHYNDAGAAEEGAPGLESIEELEETIAYSADCLQKALDKVAQA